MASPPTPAASSGSTATRSSAFPAIRNRRPVSVRRTSTDRAATRGYPSGFGTNPSPEIFIDNVFGYSDNLTWQKGRHLMKFGGEFTPLPAEQLLPRQRRRTGRVQLHRGLQRQSLLPRKQLPSIPSPTFSSIAFRMCRSALLPAEPASASGATACTPRTTSR